MSRIISTFLRVLLASALPCTLYPQALEESSAAGIEILNPASAEDEAFLKWIEDPLEELGLKSESLIIWSSSIALGPGYSSNFLKRSTPTGGRYLKLESDFFINAMLEKSTIMALLYVEGAQYDTDTEVDNEAMVLLHANWTRLAGSWSFGPDLDVFAGDQIFDASLSSNAQPVGERLRQVRPDLTLFLEANFGNKDSFRLMINTERVLFQRSEDDYWSPGIEIEWNRSWLESLESTSSIKYFEERYDEEVSLDRRGFTMASRELLEIRGYAAEEEISWNPSFASRLQLTTRAGAAYEEDTHGENDDALRLWSSLSATLKLPWFDLRTIGRWQSTRYQNRQLDFFDERLQRQNYRSLRMEMEKKLPWDLALRLVLEWEDFDSRISSEQFSERRVETLLGWSY